MEVHSQFILELIKYTIRKLRRCNNNFPSHIQLFFFSGLINASPRLLQGNKFDRQQEKMLASLKNSLVRGAPTSWEKNIYTDTISRNCMPTIHKPNKIKKHLKKDNNLWVKGRKVADDPPKTDKPEGGFDFDGMPQSLKSSSTSTNYMESRRQSNLFDQAGMNDKNSISPRMNQSEYI